MEAFLLFLLKPFAVLLFFAVLLGVRFAVIRWWPDSKLKRYLLTRVY